MSPGELLERIAAEIDPVEGESLRDRELRMQAHRDPLIWEATTSGIPRTDIAKAAGVTTTAVGNALARVRRLRDTQKKAPRPDWDAMMANLIDERAKLSAVIEALDKCLPFLRRE